MASLVLLGLAALLGTGSSFSSAINGLIGREIGLIKATFLFLSLGTGLSAILGYWLEGNIFSADLFALFVQQPYLLAPGLINSFFIIVIIRSTALVGTTLTTASLFSGQMLMSLWLDHVGFAGLRKIPITPLRVGAVIVLLLGVTLLSLSNKKAATSPTSTNNSAVSFRRKTITPWGLNLWIIAAVLVVGGLLSGASSINAVLGQQTGVFTATLFFLGPGVLLLPLLSLVIDPFSLQVIKSWRPLYVIPGLLNVLSIAGSVFLIPILGVQLMVSTVFTAKVLTGLLIDGLGLFGLPRSPITRLRLLAAAVLSLGVTLSSFYG